MRVDLIIFDCDGVIADSEVLSAQVLIDQLARLDIVVTPDDVRRDFLGRSFPTVAASIRDRFALTLPADFEATYRARLLARFDTDLRTTPGFADALAQIRLPVCVATSSSPPRVARTLAVLDLAQRFGADVFTASQVARGKPAPDLFLLAARELGVDPADCVILEDSPHGVTGALRAGSRAVGFVGGTHLDNRRAEHAALLRATGAAPVLDSMNGMFAALTTSA